MPPATRGRTLYCVFCELSQPRASRGPASHVLLVLTIIQEIPDGFCVHLSLVNETDTIIIIILLFDIKTRTLGFAFGQPPKKSLPKSLTQKKSLQNFNPQKVLRSKISNPKKGFAHPRHLYTCVPPPPPPGTLKM